MTVLSACQSAAIRLTGQRPSAIFSSTGQFEMELGEIATEAAISIMKARDWQALTTLKTQAGDGTTTAFSLPDDYDRMPLGTRIYSSGSQVPLIPVLDLDQWQEFQITSIVGAPGYWIIVGGQLQILPAMGASDTARYYYVSNNIATGKTAFSSDSDVFLLSERLLSLAIIWRWRASKGLEYAEHMKNFELAFSEEAGRDKGARILTVGRTRRGDGEISSVGSISTGTPSGDYLVVE